MLGDSRLHMELLVGELAEDPVFRSCCRQFFLYPISKDPKGVATKGCYKNVGCEPAAFLPLPG